MENDCAWHGQAPSDEQLAKALAENKDSLLTAHASFSAMDPQLMADCGIELHPGAAEYYQSAGLMK